jgi:hypothetical protein
MGRPYAVRLGLPGPAGVTGGGLAEAADCDARGADDTAEVAADAAAATAAAEDPAAGELSAPIYRMRFGRDLRLAEVRHAHDGSGCVGLGVRWPCSDIWFSVQSASWRDAPGACSWLQREAGKASMLHHCMGQSILQPLTPIPWEAHRCL